MPDEELRVDDGHDSWIAGVFTQRCIKGDDPTTVMLRPATAAHSHRARRASCGFLGVQSPGSARRDEGGIGGHLEDGQIVPGCEISLGTQAATSELGQHGAETLARGLAQRLSRLVDIVIENDGGTHGYDDAMMH
jgi:hypothetical protein